jgi:hypothetical protein
LRPPGQAGRRVIEQVGRPYAKLFKKRLGASFVARALQQGTVCILANQRRVLPSPLEGEGGRAQRGRMRGAGRNTRASGEFLCQQWRFQQKTRRVSSNTPHPSWRFAPIHLLPQGEKGEPQASPSPRPAFTVWPFKERSLPRKEKSGSGAQDRASLMLVGGAVSRAPPAFLPYRRGRGVCAARPRSGPGPRGSSPSRTPSCDRSSAVPATLIRFMTRVPAQEMPSIMLEAFGAWMKIF